MNKKDTETKFEIQDNQINFLTEGHHELWKKLKSLEFKTDRIEERLKNQESIKLDTDLHINAYEFSKNRCPRCGSHNLHYAFSRYGLDDSEVYCKDCNNHWKFGHSDVAPKNPYEENEELKDVNKKLGNEIEELVHKYDTMNRRYLDVREKYHCVQDELERARDHIKTQNSKIALLDNRSKKLEDENKELKEKNEVLNAGMNVVFNNFSLVESKTCNGGSIGSLQGRNFCSYLGLHDDEFIKLKNAWKVMNVN